MQFRYPPGATPIDKDEAQGLIPSYINTQVELNAAEQANILEAQSWALGRQHKAILTDAFIRKLHQRMFKRVWQWAGTYRKSDKSIGIHWPQISTELQKLCGDSTYWIEHLTYPWDELGVRFHHRLVSIHPFPNGNGRHARLLTDVLMTNNDQEPFTWGARSEKAEIGKNGLQNLT
jgi:Fic-DOC domain mobile mystery protein B